jgi:hypothetical protein
MLTSLFHIFIGSFGGEGDLCSLWKGFSRCFFISVIKNSTEHYSSFGFSSASFLNRGGSI